MKAFFSYVLYYAKELNKVFPIFKILIIIFALYIVIFLTVRGARKFRAWLKLRKNKLKDKREKKDKDGDGTDDGLGDGVAGDQLSELREAFKRASKHIKENVSSEKRDIYIPWYIMAGQTNAGKTTALAGTDSHLSMDLSPLDDLSAKKACNFWFFDNGIVLDVNGDYVLKDDGQTSDTRSWSELAILLQQYHPAKAVDGIVVTISCEDLLPKKSETDANAADHIGDLIFKKIHKIQKALSVRLPVYVLVTKCDTIKGFESFCDRVPGNTVNDIFGWSNPNSIESDFESAWLDDAFAEIAGRLRTIQFETFTEKSDFHINDFLYLFPEEFKKIEDGAKIFANRLFNREDYFKAFLFRGIFFTGASDATEPEKKSFFVKGLFEDKVFPEYTLSELKSKFRLPRSYKILAANIFTVFFFIFIYSGLWFAYGNLKQEVSSLQFVMDLIYDDLVEGSKTTSIEKDAFKKHSIKLLDGMTKIETSSLSSPFCPSSWFNSINERIADAIAVSYDQIIIKTIHDELIKRAYLIIKKDIRQPLYVGQTPTMQETPEFIIFKQYIGELVELQSYLELYNGLKDAGNESLGDLGKIIKFLFDINLPDSFYSNAGFYEKAMNNASVGKIDVRQFQADSRKKADLLAQRFFDRVFSRSEIVLAVTDLSKELDAFEEAEARNSSNSETAQSLLDNIAKTAQLISRPKNDWVHYDRMNLGPFYDNIISQITSCELLDFDMDYMINEHGAAKFKELSKYLNTVSSPVTGTLFKRVKPEAVPGQNALASKAASNKKVAGLKDKANAKKEAAAKKKEAAEKKKAGAASKIPGDSIKGDVGKEVDMPEAPVFVDNPVRLELKQSDTLAGLTQTLKDYLNQQQASSTEDMEFPTYIPVGQRLTWKQNVLDEAVAEYEKSKKYLEERLKDTPDESKKIIEEMSRKNLGEMIVDHLKRAVSFSKEERWLRPIYKEMRLKTDIEKFALAAVKLKHIIEIFDELQLNMPRGELFALVTYHSQMLLDEIDIILKSDSLYLTDGISLGKWDGMQDASLAAFGTASEAELEHLLGVYRKRLKHIAYNYASPLVKFSALLGPTFDSEHVKALYRWEDIIKEFDKYYEQVEKKEEEEKAKAAEEEKAGKDKAEEKKEEKKEEVPVPDNEVSKLQAFIIRDLNGAGKLNYMEKISDKDLLLRPRSYFGKVKQNITKTVYERCEAIALNSLYAEYMKIEELYNKKLAGRYPFTDLPGTRDALPDDIFSFFTSYKNFKPYKNVMIKYRSRFTSDSLRAIDFVENLEKLEDFFKTFLDETNQLPTYTLKLEFRVNKDYEYVANQIIGWEFKSGKKRVNNNDEEKKLKWSAGDPVVMEIRWAENGTDFPVDFKDRTALNVDGKAADFVYEQYWSLFKLINDYKGKATDFPRAKDPEPHTLGFEVDIKRAAFPSGVLFDLTTKAYARIEIWELGADDKTRRLVLPEFPPSAPRLTIRETGDGNYVRR